MMHLLSCFREVLSKIEKKPIFLFLDFDGTLAPLAPTPREAILPADMRDLIGRLAALPMVKIAVISGREIGDLKEKVGIEGIIYSGNHGLECDHPGPAFDAKVDPRMLEKLAGAGKEIHRELSGFPEAVIEDKTYSLSVHYRKVPAGRQDLLRRIVEKAVQPYVKARQFVLSEGKMVLEIRLNTDWHKGKIVRYLLDRFPGPVPIYIGDDRTDEDAFAVVRPLGLTVFVGENNGDSQADYFLDGPTEVREFLELIYNNFRQDG
jgi:trehalose-phosphatase